MSVNNTHVRVSASSTNGGVFGLTDSTDAGNSFAAAAAASSLAANGGDDEDDRDADSDPVLAEIVAEHKKRTISGTNTEKQKLLNSLHEHKNVFAMKLHEFRGREAAEAFKESVWDGNEIKKQRHKAEDFSGQLIKAAQVLIVSISFVWLIVYLESIAHALVVVTCIPHPISRSFNVPYFRPSLVPDHPAAIRGPSHT